MFCSSRNGFRPSNETVCVGQQVNAAMVQVDRGGMRESGIWCHKGIKGTCYGIGPLLLVVGVRLYSVMYIRLHT